MASFGCLQNGFVWCIEVLGLGEGFGLEAAEVQEGFAQGAFQAGLVAAEPGKGVRFVVVAPEEVGQGLGGGKILGQGLGSGGVGVGLLLPVVLGLVVVLLEGAGVGLLDGLAAGVAELLEEGGFGGGQATQSPGEQGDAFGEAGFQGTAGVQVLEHLLAEGLVGLLALGGQKSGGGGAEAVGEGIAGGASLAFRGFGAGGLLGVSSVGCRGVGRRAAWVPPLE